MSAVVSLPASLQRRPSPAMVVLPCLDGQRRILIEAEASVLVYTLFEPTSAGAYGILREVEGEVMGRADTRIADRSEPWDYDRARGWELAQRRRAEEQIIAHCPELQYVDRDKTPLGVYRARGQIRFIGSFAARERQAAAQRCRRGGR